MKRLLLTVALLANASVAQAGDVPIDEDRICVDIGLNEKVYLCSENGYNQESNYWFNDFYLLRNGQQSKVTGIREGFATYTMLPCPSGQYLAMTQNGGEGHPLLSIMTLEEIRQGEEPRYTAGYDPYPGSIFDLRWDGHKLLFNSDVRLSSLTSDEMIIYEVTFSLDAETGELQQIGEPVAID